MPRARTGTAPAAEAPAKPTAAVIVTPPPNSRTRKSTAAPELIADTAAQSQTGWASDGLTYDSKKDAGNAAVVLRRAVIRFLGGDPNGKADATAKRVHSQVWEVATVDGTLTGDPLTTDKGGIATGRWVFALNTSAAADAATA